MSLNDINYNDEAVAVELSEEGESNFNEHLTEGQLAVDVAQTEDEIIIVAALAGTKPEDISLHLHGDVLTIRGRRHSCVPPSAGHLYRECYWGKFSRTIVLPVEVRPESARAEYHHGVLTVRLDKTQSDSRIPIEVVDE